MKFIVLAFALGIVVGDRLDNTYLPPFNAKTASGNHLLAPPLRHKGAVSQGIASSYIPSSVGQFPNQVYNTPSAGTYSAYTSSAPVAILRFNNDNVGDGSYRFEYDTANNIHQHQVGQFTSTGVEQGSGIVQGAYSYTGPDGITYTVNYIADENGFRASGDHLPTPPPIPETIQRSLEINAGTKSSGYAGTRSGLNRQYLSPSYSKGYHY